MHTISIPAMQNHSHIRHVFVGGILNENNYTNTSGHLFQSNLDRTFIFQERILYFYQYRKIKIFVPPSTDLGQL